MTHAELLDSIYEVADIWTLGVTAEEVGSAGHRPVRSAHRAIDPCWGSLAWSVGFFKLSFDVELEVPKLRERAAWKSPMVFKRACEFSRSLASPRRRELNTFPPSRAQTVRPAGRPARRPTRRTCTNDAFVMMGNMPIVRVVPRSALPADHHTARSNEARARRRTTIHQLQRAARRRRRRRARGRRRW